MNLSGYRTVLSDSRIRQLFVVAFFARMPAMAAPLVFTLHVVKDLDASYAQAGLVATASTLGAGIGSPWRGRLIDRLGLRRAVIPSIVAVGLLYPLAVIASYWFLLPIVFFMGLLLIPIFSVMRQSLSVMVPEGDRRAAYSADGVIAEMSFIIGPAIGVLTVSQFGAEVALAFIGACEVIAGLVLLRLNPPTRSEASDPAAERSATWMSVPIGFIFLIAAGSVIALYSTDLGIVAELEELDQTAAIAVVFGLWGFASLVGGAFYGASDFSIRPTYLLLALGLTTVPVGLANSVPALALAVIPCGFLCAPTLTAASEWLAKLTPEDRRGEAMGWFGTSHTIGAALAGPLIGVSIDEIGPGGGFAVGGSVAVAIGLIVLGGQLIPRFRPEPVDELAR